MDQKKWEYKELIPVNQTKTILREWLSALEEDRDLHLTIQGQECHIPKEALKLGKTKAEYELKNDEFELELELKWRKDQLS